MENIIALLAFFILPFLAAAWSKVGFREMFPELGKAIKYTFGTLFSDTETNKGDVETHDKMDEKNISRHSHSHNKY